MLGAQVCSGFARGELSPLLLLGAKKKKVAAVLGCQVAWWVVLTSSTKLHVVGQSVTGHWPAVWSSQYQDSEVAVVAQTKT